ncbi:MAG: hypothetical protein AAF992_20550 [Bacteroidota bacterium]
MDIDELRQQYIELTNEVMPSLAREKNWPVQFNHCFQRIILDTLFQDCWYNHLNRSRRIPAYKQLNNSQLQQAIDIAQRMISSSETVLKLNRNSLAYRNKLVTPINS